MVLRNLCALSALALFTACGSSGNNGEKPDQSSSSSSSSSGGGQTQVSVFGINSGGRDYQTVSGITYVADVYSTAGSGASTMDTIADTEDETLFQSERWGLDFSYEIPVTSGTFDVTLHMIELYWNAMGERIQNITIEGNTVLENFDTFATVGHDAAVSYQFTDIAVDDGFLTIQFVGVEDAGNVAGILVEAQSGFILTPEPPAKSQIIKVNQLGYYSGANKIAIVPDTESTTFSVVNTANDSVVYTDNLSEASDWAPSDESVKQADFSAFATPGVYKIVVDGLEDSPVFNIGDDIYSGVHDAALKAYYFNRASIALEETYAGVWARAAGHPDDQVEVLAAAATDERPEGTIISAAKGWYDAGDYNKYIVNAGISTYTLLAAYEHFRTFYSARDINIPESGNTVPDILDEVFWNIEWMEDMQDLDGGVYHKLTTLGFSGIVMPENATAQRYVEMKTTAATLDFAAVMAVASRVYANYEAEFPGKAAAYRQAAINAWSWAQANPDVTFTPNGTTTGTYSQASTTLSDEFAWAAAELFILTEEPAYLTAFTDNTDSAVGTPWWGGVGPLAYISLVEHGEGVLSADAYSALIASVTSHADEIVLKQQSSSYLVPMEEADFAWGSNSGALNQALMAYQAYRITDDTQYLGVVYAVMDYIFGRNATEYSFVTGFGTKSPLGPHHRPSEADDIVEPVPGFVVGGPNAGQQDEAQCSGGYPTTLPALSYIDDWCSYASNEVTINWNAPLVYLLAAMEAEAP